MFLKETGKLLRTIVQFNQTINKNIHLSCIKRRSFANWYRSLWVPKTTEPPYEHVVQIGDPVLRQRAAPVPVEAITSKEVQFFIKNMIRVLRKYKAVGLSAPQIGISLQVIVLEFTAKTRSEFPPEIQRVRNMTDLPLTVIVLLTCITNV